MASNNTLPQTVTFFTVILNFDHGDDSTGGFGAGFGFSIECGGQPVLSWGSGFGGGIDAVTGQQSVRVLLRPPTQPPTASAGKPNTHTQAHTTTTWWRRGRLPVLQAGFGGGGGGQYQNSDGSVADFGGGCGCGALPDGLPTSCGSAPDTDSETLLRDWLAQGAAVLAATPACQSGMTLCGSGGGGGGYTSSNGCPGGFGGGFGFEFAPVSLSQQGGDGGVGVVLGLGDDDGASCSAQTPGGNPPPSASIGPAARTCGTQCATSSAFNGCFCPCFKDKMVAAGVPWAKQINCNT